MGSTSVHASAIVEKGAQLGEGVRVGPFCHISGDARLGDSVNLLSGVTVLGATTIGEGTLVYPGAVLGGAPQNHKHKGGRTTLTIGKNCVIRESATMHTGSDTGHGTTTVGDNCMFMAYTHVAHDCIVGDNVTFANNASLSGHCEVGNNVIISGMTAVHQFVRIGHHAFLGGMSAIVGDVIPYGMAVGNRAHLRGFNVIGIKRSGLPRSELLALRKAYRMIFDHDHPVAENLEKAREAFTGSHSVADVIEFMTSRGKRYFTVPALHGGDDDDDDGED
ncbi:MAG: acyl-ACP--UDP-N-acetylglucosamine O-acyltransferase [Hyphomicrobiales bacterium]|nr:acyl-ACP--UDP-N-acetylglucosamine O-acyltransferase [Hyphomicrobiales bacterium]